MADATPPPVTPSVPAIDQNIAKNTAEMKAGTAAADTLNSAYERIGETSKSLVQGLSFITSGLSKLGITASNAAGTISAAMITLGDPTAVNGLTKSLGNLDAKFGDAKHINSYSDQFTQLKNNMSNYDPATVIDKLNALGRSFKIDEGLLSGAKKVKDGKEDLAGTAAALGELVGRYLKVADTQRNFGISIMATAASMGNLNVLYTKAGDNLSGLNDIISAHTGLIDASARETNMAPEAVQKYYNALSQLPNVFSSTANTSGAMFEKIAIGNRSLSMLSATVQLAAGTQRDLASIQGDLTNATDNYNITGEKSLVYVARMSELSSNLGIELSKVKQYMNSTAQTFGMLGNQAESSARMVNTMMSSLKDTGISATQAMSLVQEFTNSIAGLNVAQRSLLSSTSGGPGGLMGGFKITEMLKEGRLDEVGEMMQNSLKNMMGGGRLVTSKEASQSESAAAQYQKQLTMLQSGPFSGVIKNEASAMKFLEGMANNGKVDVSALKDSNALLAETTKRGSDLQQSTYSVMSELNISTQELTTANIELSSKLAFNVIGMGNTAVAKYGEASSRAGNRLGNEAIGSATKGRRVGTAERAFTQGGINLAGGVDLGMRALGGTFGLTEEQIAANNRADEAAQRLKDSRARLDEMKKKGDKVDVGEQNKLKLAEREAREARESAKRLRTPPVKIGPSQVEAPVAAAGTPAPRATADKLGALQPIKVNFNPLKVTVEAICTKCHDKLQSLQVNAAMGGTSEQ